MQNTSIIGKFLTIMAVFGLFTLGVVAYSSTQILKVNGLYGGLISGEVTAAQKLVRANRAFQTARADIAELSIARSNSEKRKALDDLKVNQDFVIKNFGMAMAALPSEARFAQINAEVVRVLSEPCKPAIDAAVAATTEAAIKSSQDLFQAECQPLFPILTKTIVTMTDELVKNANDRTDDVTAISNATVMTAAVGSLFGLMIVMLYGFFAIRAWMVAPIKSLACVMGRVADADFAVDVSGQDAKMKLAAWPRPYRCSRKMA